MRGRCDDPFADFEDIDKVFNELKGKMEERKPWASSPVAKRAHGQFECLAHNLSLLAERERP